MYKTHPEFPTPDRRTVIWHYFTLPKFLSFLQTQSLYLCRHDMYDDNHEGRLSAKDMSFFEGISPGMMKGMRWDQYGCSYSSCWTRSDVDEFVLWSSYSSLKDGIAVKSTIGRLIDSLSDNDSKDLYISDVLYIDYQEDYTFKKSGGVANLIAPHFVKRRYFLAEKEIRVMYFDPHARFEKSPNGLLAPVNLEMLIESVYVSPFSQKWFMVALEDLLKRYDLVGKTVLKSEI